MYGHLDFWKNKKVLLTGHTGFKGSWMSLMLKELGAEVCGYSLPLNKYSFYEKIHPDIYRHEEGDIADQKRVISVVESFKPEIVIHFASHSSLDRSRKIPDYILRTNLMGCVSILEAVRVVESVKALVMVTSDKCYQNKETEIPYKEDAPLGAKDPYSTSKVCQEILTQCYRDTFFKKTDRAIQAATARASNVIGAGDYNITRLMPYLLDTFSHKKIPQIRNPYAVRPWQYVLDVLYGYLLLAEKLYENPNDYSQFGGAYNFGPREDGFAQVGYVTELVSERFGNLPYEIKTDKEQNNYETKILKLDSSKAQKLLHWMPQKNLRETIALSVTFVKSEMAGHKVDLLARKYIRDYLEGACVECIKN